eukprot:scaffold154723_cov15-Tisochrysis_lutea.AAC.1
MRAALLHTQFQGKGAVLGATSNGSANFQFRLEIIIYGVHTAPERLIPGRIFSMQALSPPCRGTGPD